MNEHDSSSSSEDDMNQSCKIEESEHIMKHLLSKEGMKSSNVDFKNLFKYYGYGSNADSNDKVSPVTSTLFNVYGSSAKSFLLPETMISSAKRIGVWSIYLGDPDGFARHQLIRDLLNADHFREFVDYPELLNKVYRAKFITQMIAELNETQDEIDGLQFKILK